MEFTTIQYYNILCKSLELWFIPHKTRNSTDRSLSRPDNCMDIPDDPDEIARTFRQTAE